MSQPLLGTPELCSTCILHGQYIGWARTANKAQQPVKDLNKCASDTEPCWPAYLRSGTQIARLRLKCRMLLDRSAETIAHPTDFVSAVVLLVKLFPPRAVLRPLCSSYSALSNASGRHKVIKHANGSPAGAAVRGRAERLVPRNEDVHVAAMLFALFHAKLCSHTPVYENKAFLCLYRSAQSIQTSLEPTLICKHRDKP